MNIVLEILGYLLTGLITLSLLAACFVALYYMFKDIYYIYFKKPSQKEALEIENTEFDYGHNVKNYTEDDYE